MEATLESVGIQLEAVERELGRRRYLVDPVAWAEERLKDTLWSGQKRIMKAVQMHRKTAIMTCHGIGKSFIASDIAGWWLDSHKTGEAFVVTTAPTAPQVKVILWKEIGRVHARGELRGRVNQTEWIMEVNGKEEIVALGRKPNDYSPTAFQGIHAPFVLVIIDEANGVRGVLWDAIDSLIANEGSKMLAIFNPDDPSGEIFEACKPNSGWHIDQIGAFDTPNFTGEALPQPILNQLIGPSYVEEKRKKWASKWFWVDKNGEKCLPGQLGVRCVPPPEGKLEDTHPFWQSKILGLFPVQSGAGSLIPLPWIRAAQTRSLKPSQPVEMGLDVGASEDGDPSCLGWRRGQVFRILYEERQPDTMKTLGHLMQCLNTAKYGTEIAKVDYIGVGRGVVDRAKELREVEKSTAKVVIPISVGMMAKDPREFSNLLSEIWWSIRGMFERGEIDIDEDDEELAEELLTVRWEPNSKGQTVVSYADGPSPNRADALLITFAPVENQVLSGVPVGIERTSPWFDFGDMDMGDRARSRWRM